MNLLLLREPDLVGDGRARVAGRRARHIRKILRLGVGDRLRVGRLDGPLGEGELVRVDRDEVLLELRWSDTLRAPPPSPLTVAFAMPRPPTLAKVLQQLTAMGVKRFWIFGARRVEKSYWDASGATVEVMQEQMILGLEQGKDTRMPELRTFRYFRPFVEEVLGAQSELGPVWVADLGVAGAQPAADGAAKVLVLGPEGGFVDFERERFDALGHRRFSWGERPLRVETAAVALCARLTT